MNPMVTLVQFNFTIICILINLLGLSCTLSAEDILIPKFTFKFGWLELDFQSSLNLALMLDDVIALFCP